MIEAYIDGACEPHNPGGTATYGVYIVNGTELVDELWGVHGAGDGMTNNVAEFSAMCRALERLAGVDEPVTIYTDSQLVANIMNDKWPIRGGAYANTARVAKELRKGFPNITFTWVPRETNTFADGLSKRALAEVGIKSRNYR